jgi:hypothetical protein
VHRRPNLLTNSSNFVVNLSFVVISDSSDHFRFCVLVFVAFPAVALPSPIWPPENFIPVRVVCCTFVWSRFGPEPPPDVCFWLEFSPSIVSMWYCSQRPCFVCDSALWMWTQLATLFRGKQLKFFYLHLSFCSVFSASARCLWIILDSSGSGVSTMGKETCFRYERGSCGIPNLTAQSRNNRNRWLRCRRRAGGVLWQINANFM